MIPDSAQRVPDEGYVVAIGDDFQIPHIKIGDEVIYAKYGGVTIRKGKIEYILLEESEIYGIIGKDIQDAI